MDYEFFHKTTKRHKKSLDELNWMVEKAIKDNDNVMRTKRCLSLEEKPRGNLYRYSKGSIIAIKGKENDNLVFFLFALNEFDNNNHNKEMRKDELKILLHKLIDFCNENSQGYDIEMPIVSTVFAIPKLTASQSVELIMSSLFEKIDMVKSNYTIVVPNDCFDEIKQNIKE